MTNVRMEWGTVRAVVDPMSGVGVLIVGDADVLDPFRQVRTLPSGVEGVAYGSMVGADWRRAVEGLAAHDWGVFTDEYGCPVGVAGWSGEGQALSLEGPAIHDDISLDDMVNAERSLLADLA